MRVLTLVVLLVGTIQQPVEKTAIDRAKSASVQRLDAALPDVALEPWLRSVFGAATTAWEVNDCGEQTGNPAVDRDRDLPMCVEAAVTLDSRRTLHLVVAVGSLKTGVSASPPTFAYGVLTEGGQPSRWLRALGESANVGR